MPVLKHGLLESVAINACIINELSGRHTASRSQPLLSCIPLQTPGSSGSRLVPPALYFTSLMLRWQYGMLIAIPLQSLIHAQVDI